MLPGWAERFAGSRRRVAVVVLAGVARGQCVCVVCVWGDRRDGAASAPCKQAETGGRAGMREGWIARVGGAGCGGGGREWRGGRDGGDEDGVGGKGVVRQAEATGNVRTQEPL